MRNFINRLVFFVGWLLSPFTFWNDAFINIPVSYLAASFLTRFIHIHFLTLVLVCYWLSNVVGIAMMYASGRSLIKEGRSIAREMLKFLVTMAVYSLILILLGKSGILKPV